MRLSIRQAVHHGGGLFSFENKSDGEAYRFYPGDLTIAALVGELGLSPSSFDRVKIAPVSPLFRTRTMSGMLFAGLMTASAVLALQNTSIAKAPVQAHDAVIALRQAVVPQAPSAFEIESVMTPEELLDRWNPMIAAAAKRFGVREDWIRAVMRRETGGRTMLAPNQKILSPMGAMGLMQVMPDTYAEMRDAYGLGPDPFNPEDNINAGAAYLRFLKEKYGFPAMLAAYNAGPGRLEDHLKGASALPEETRNYVSSIARYLKLETKTAKFAALLKVPSKKSVLDEAKEIAAPAPVIPKEYLDGANAAYNFDHNVQVARDAAAAVAAATPRSAF
jgi:hypothetical protein